MRWADQLIKLSKFELEVLQVRLADVVQRRTIAELRLAVLIAEGEAELMHARTNPEAGWYLAQFNEGLAMRKAAVQREIDLAAAEEAGARDALSEAFEALKKYEMIAENARLVAVKETARIDGAVLDELGLRQAIARG
ncbi:MAG: flagellar export protein FliJ [Caulobacterales bacterium]